jgi:hypothetical protein
MIKVVELVLSLQKQQHWSWIDEEERADNRNTEPG